MGTNMRMLARALLLLLAPAMLAAAPSKRSDKDTKAFELDCLAAHNKWRRLHRAPELEFDAKIGQFAQKRADFIAQSDGAQFRHPDDLEFGENLAWHSVAQTGCANLVKMWYDEVEKYDFGAPKFSMATGHFTQLVWRDTKRVGCARAVSTGPNGGIYLVCNYDPPGNMLGENAENVLSAQGRPPSGSGDSPVGAPTTMSSRDPSSSTSAISVTDADSTTPTTLRPSEAKRKDKKKTKKKQKKKKKEEKEKEKEKKKNKKKRKNKKKKNKAKTTTTTSTTTARPSE